MKNYDNHFIDSNIILGFIVGWDSQRTKSCKYFNLDGFKRYGSEKVFHECEEVLARNKVWIKQFIEQVGKECRGKASTNHSNDLSKIIEKVIKLILQQYITKAKKVRGVISGFSNNFKSEIIGIMKGKLDSRNFLKQIDKAFKDARNNLIYVFKDIIEKKHVPGNLKSTLFPEYRRLQAAKELHDKDILILLDSHYISTSYARTVIAFLTFDKGIIRSKKVIEENLGIKVIAPPIE